MKLTGLMVAAVAALALTAGASNASTSHSRPSLTDRHVGNGHAELVAQRDVSAKVIGSLAGSWKVAPRHASCWSHVPWAKVCDQARRKLLRHRWLHHLAVTRLAKLYPVSSWPPHDALWRCISRFEGSPTSVNPNGHYGMLQMHANWGYGTSTYASDDSQLVQEWAAERAYAEAQRHHRAVSFLYGQWFDYDGAAGSCLSLA